MHNPIELVMADDSSHVINGAGTYTPAALCCTQEAGNNNLFVRTDVTDESRRAIQARLMS